MGAHRKYERTGEYRFPKWHKKRDSENPKDMTLVVVDDNWHSSNYRTKFIWEDCGDFGVLVTNICIETDDEEETHREFEEFAKVCARNVWDVQKNICVAKDMWTGGTRYWELYFAFRLPVMPKEQELEAFYRLLKRLDTPSARRVQNE